MAKSKAKKKPRKTLEQIAQEQRAQRMLDLAAVGVQELAADLPSQEAIEVTRTGHARASHPNGPKVDADSARRLDAFEALRDGMDKGAYNAARRLERDIATSLDQHDRGRSLMRVDNDNRGDRTDKIIEASRLIEGLKKLISEREWWLLYLLVQTPANQFQTWREVVYYVTGETDPNSQGAAVRLACGNLADAYDAFDRTQRDEDKLREPELVGDSPRRALAEWVI